MKRIVLKLVVFILPLGVVLTSVYLGDVLPIEWIVNWQAGDANVLYGPRFELHQKTYLYRIMSVNQREPDVIILGSSRAMMLRAPVFRDTVTFYNAAGPDWRVLDIVNFYSEIEPSAIPELVFLSVDQPWFNPDYADALHFDPSSPVNYWNLVTYGISVFPSDVTNGILTFNPFIVYQEPIHQSLSLGFGAQQGYGYRNDGSVQRSHLIADYDTYSQGRLERDWNALLNRSEHFVSGGDIAEGRFNRLENILIWAREHGTIVIGYSPPFAPDFYEVMMSSGDYAYIEQATVRLRALFATYGFAYFDYTNPASLGVVQEDDFWDGWHMSERLMVQLILRIYRNLPDTLSEYIDSAYLEQTLTQSREPHDYFGADWDT